MKYIPGEKVLIKREMPPSVLRKGIFGERKHFGKIVTVSTYEPDGTYRIREDDPHFYWHENCFEPVPEKVVRELERKVNIRKVVGSKQRNPNGFAKIIMRRIKRAGREGYAPENKREYWAVSELRKKGEPIMNVGHRGSPRFALLKPAKVVKVKPVKVKPERDVAMLEFRWWHVLLVVMLLTAYFTLIYSLTR